MVNSLLTLLSVSTFISSNAMLKLRQQQPRQQAPHLAKSQLGVPIELKRCDTKRVKSGVQLLEEGQRSKAVFFDGFSRYGCEKDVSPKEQRIYFKEHACGTEVSSCRLLELPMKPRLCFDFCRDKNGARFFGIENGRDCYCTGYVHAKSTGGGDCDQACQGDTDEMCGGMTKSSVFEMHMCGDSAGEAGAASEKAEAVLGECKAVAKNVAETVVKLRALGQVWKLGVCSVKPEGDRVCSPPTDWLKLAGEAEAVVAKSSHQAEVVGKCDKELSDALEVVEGAGKEVDSKQASALELASDALNAATAKAVGALAASKLTLQKVNGPFAGKPMEQIASVYKAVGDTENGWNALCGLRPIKGQSYAAVAKDDPALCANFCLGKSTGTEGCVAFNYQYKDGLAACQLLSRNGVVESDTSLVWAVPIFEVSDSKKADMNLASIACYVNKGFMTGHPKGPLNTDVIQEITASL